MRGAKEYKITQRNERELELKQNKLLIMRTYYYGPKYKEMKTTGYTIKQVYNEGTWKFLQLEKIHIISPWSLRDIICSAWAKIQERPGSAWRKHIITSSVIPRKPISLYFRPNNALHQKPIRQVSSWEVNYLMNKYL